MSALPPLPDGFNLDAALPPLPSGFSLDEQPAPSPQAPSPSPTQEPESFGAKVLKPVTDIPREAYNATAEQLSSVNENLNPFSAAASERRSRGEPPTFLGTGKGILSAISAPFAPIQGAARSLIGHPLSWVMPTATPEEQARLKKAGISPEMIPGATTAENYEKAKGDVDTATMALGTRGVSPRGANVPAPIIPKPQTVGDLNVPLTVGEATGEFSKIRDEHLARRGGLGDKAQETARQFDESRTAALDAARQDISREMDPFGKQVIAPDAQAAAELASQAIQREAASQRAGYKDLYDKFRQEPGEFQQGSFGQIKPSIVQRLSQAQDPIILDDASRVVSPNAHRALDFLENYFTNEKGPVDPKQIDRVGKALVSIYRDSMQNPPDKRATQAVVNSFGKHIDDALDAGLFSGSDQAIQTWKDARAAFRKYKQTFGPQGPGDEVGRAMEKILGRYDGQAATPTEVANYLYGASNVGQKGSSVRISNRVKDVLGEGSPEWAGVKQGLWNKLTESVEGRADWGPQKVSERIFEFLNGAGKPLANSVFSVPERDLMLRYASLVQKMVPPPGAVNYSNTAPVLKRIMDRTGGAIMHVLGVGTGYALGDTTGALIAPIVTESARGAARRVTDNRAARQIAKLMPDIQTSMVQWQRAQQKLIKNNSPPNRRAAEIATSNLARSLANVGVDFNAVMAEVQGPSGAKAENNE